MEESPEVLERAIQILNGWKVKCTCDPYVDHETDCAWWDAIAQADNELYEESQRELYW